MRGSNISTELINPLNKLKMKTNFLKTIRLSQKEQKPDFMILDYRIDHIFSSMFENEHKYEWVHNFISAN